MTAETEDINYTDVARLVQDISALYLNQEFSDVIFIIGGEKLHAHKVIVAVRSNYFKTLLYDDSKAELEIPISDVSIEAFRKLLKYLYTGSVTVETSNVNLAAEVLGLAHQHSFKELEAIIMKKLKTMISMKNVSSILEVANRYDLSELVEICQIFLNENAIEVPVE